MATIARVTRSSGSSPSGPLPAFMDRKAVAAETGFPRSQVDAVFRALPITVFPGSRKPMVRRADVARYLDEHTYPPGSVRP